MPALWCPCARPWTRLLIWVFLDTTRRCMRFGIARGEMCHQTCCSISLSQNPGTGQTLPLLAALSRALQQGLAAACETEEQLAQHRVPALQGPCRQAGGINPPPECCLKASGAVDLSRLSAWLQPELSPEAPPQDALKAQGEDVSHPLAPRALVEGMWLGMPLSVHGFCQLSHLSDDHHIDHPARDTPQRNIRTTRIIVLL